MICTSGPVQAKMSEGVTDSIALASVGGSEASLFAVHRSLPRLPRQEHGDSKVTGGNVAAAALERNAIAAILNAALQGLTPRSRHTQPATAALRERRSRRFGYNFKLTPA